MKDLEPMDATWQIRIFLFSDEGVNVQIFERMTGHCLFECTAPSDKAVKMSLLFALRDYLGLDHIIFKENEECPTK